MSDRDKSQYTLWWISGDKQGSMFFGNYSTMKDAENAIPEAEADFKSQLTDPEDWDEDGGWQIEDPSESESKSQIEIWKDQLPDGLIFGIFEDGFEFCGRCYIYGAWNTDGEPCIGWDHDAEFQQAISDYESAKVSDCAPGGSSRLDIR
jgi:hypothetical protein